MHDKATDVGALARVHAEGGCVLPGIRVSIFVRAADVVFGGFRHAANEGFRMSYLQCGDDFEVGAMLLGPREQVELGVVLVCVDERPVGRSR